VQCCLQKPWQTDAPGRQGRIYREAAVEGQQVPLPHSRTPSQQEREAAAEMSRIVLGNTLRRLGDGQPPEVVMEEGQVCFLF